MSWRAETAAPFTIISQLFFSPIIGHEVYVIDRGTNFYKYNLATQQWTQLASPNYGSDLNSRTRFFRTLAISPDGTRLACCSEGKWSTYIGSESYKTGGGRRIEIYTIATNTWTASKQLDFLIDAHYAFARSLVWEDDDTLWVWCIKHKRTASGWAIKCVKYVISTDTWTPYASAFLDTATGANGLNCGNGGCAIKADKSVVYSGGTALANYTCKKYTIATDTYTGLTLDPLTDRFCHAYDRDKIWYYEYSGTCQQGYIDVEDDSQHDDQFEENTDRDVNFGRYCGIRDDLGVIIAHAKSTAPELMSEGIVATTVTTDPATAFGQTSATLNGTLDGDGGEACACGFEYGETTAYGSTTATQSKTTGETFSQEVLGLRPGGIVYHFRAVATNSAGTSYGADRTFHTEALSAEAHQALGRHHSLGRHGL